MDKTRFDKTFKNERLREIVRSAILSGEFTPGDQLPSQNEMCEKYGVSNHTVREAIGSLVSEGLLYRIQGKGTFVAEPKREAPTIAFVTTRLHRDVEARSYIGYDIHPLLAQAIEEEARRGGAGVLISLTHDDNRAEREILLDMVRRRVTGIILYYMGAEENLDCLRQVMASGIPLVLVDRYVPALEASCVVTDNFRGAFLAVKGLLNAGFQRVYHFTIESTSTSLLDRVRGYTAAMKELTPEPDPDLLVTSRRDAFPDVPLGRDYDETRRLALEVFKDATGPFAAFAATGVALTAVWHAIEELGIPHSEVALACFDEPVEPLPEDVKLLRVIQPLGEIGRTAVQLILGGLAGPVGQRVMLEPRIRITDPVQRSAARSPAAPGSKEVT